jgi:hypothetical protein
MHNLARLWFETELELIRDKAPARRVTSCLEMIADCAGAMADARAAALESEYITLADMGQDISNEAEHARMRYLEVRVHGEGREGLCWWFLVLTGFSFLFSAKN